MGARRVWIAAVTWGLTACSSSANDSAVRPCPPDTARQMMFPGPPFLMSEYAEIKDRLPEGRGCWESEDGHCEFVDELGYTNLVTTPEPFSPLEEQDIYIYRRDAERRHGAKWLPYDVTWSDTPAEVERKLRRAGRETAEPFEPREQTNTDVYVKGCEGIGDTRLDYVFDGDQLQRVTVSFAYP